MEWQFELLKRLSKDYGAVKRGLSYIPEQASIDIKREHLKFSLKKFYRPTINNISDVANQLLWLADPLMFNDPHDCDLRIDDNFQIYCLDKFANQCDLFSQIEKSQIHFALRKNQHIYTPSVKAILQLDNRSRLFFDYYRSLHSKAENYVDQLKKQKYRIACFVQDYAKPYEYDDLMWAHYAQDFQGFCVEYDVEKIFDFVFEDYPVFDWNSKNNYLSGYRDKETLKRSVINGLFPVYYSSRPQIITSGNAFKIGTGEINDKVQTEAEYGLLKALITKGLIWKYEREWRLIISDEIVRGIGYKIPFPFIKKIIPGSSASRELKSLLKMIEKNLGLNTENKIERE